VFEFELEAEAWPIALLVLRILTVLLLYLFLLTAFRALRADLRAPAPVERPRRRVRRERAPVEVVPASVAASTTVEAWPEVGETPVEPVEPWDDEEDWEHESAVPADPERERSRLRPAFLVPVVAAVLVAGFAAGAFWLADDAPGTPSTEQVGPSATPIPPGEPPTEQPAPGRVTVGLAAREDSNLRVTVDGIVQFDGVLREGESQAWEGGARIQVWTDKGKTLQLAVNGVDLGAYSPAMDRPDWNRIDFGFWPGWAQ